MPTDVKQNRQVEVREGEARTSVEDVGYPNRVHWTSLLTVLRMLEAPVNELGLRIITAVCNSQAISQRQPRKRAVEIIVCLPSIIASHCGSQPSALSSTVKQSDKIATKEPKRPPKVFGCNICVWTYRARVANESIPSFCSSACKSP